MNTRDVLLTDLEAEKVKVPADLVYGEDTFLKDDTFYVSSHGRRGDGATSDLFCKDTDSIHDRSPHELITS
jgi:hypothetical protein